MHAVGDSCGKGEGTGGQGGHWEEGHTQEHTGTHTHTHTHRNIFFNCCMGSVELLHVLCSDLKHNGILKGRSNPLKFAQPGLSRSKGRSPPAKWYTLGCVCSCMAGPPPGVGVQIRVCLICFMSTLSNWVVQTQVFLEHVQKRGCLEHWHSERSQSVTSKNILVKGSIESAQDHSRQ